MYIIYDYEIHIYILVQNIRPPCKNAEIWIDQLFISKNHIFILKFCE